MSYPTASPTKTLENVALGKPTTQKSTFLNRIESFGSHRANDGIRGTYTHNWCGHGEWWQIDLGQEFNIERIHLVNRFDCCGGRLMQFYVKFYDSLENEIVADQVYYPRRVGSDEDIDVSVVAQYVRIQFHRRECLQLGEVEVWVY